MTAPRAAPNTNASKSVPAPEVTQEARQKEPERQDVAHDRKTGSAGSADRVEISSAARALAKVVLDDKPSLQLSAQDLRALSGGQQDI
jgi:hypothetical protein